MTEWFLRIMCWFFVLWFGFVTVAFAQEVVFGHGSNRLVALGVALGAGFGTYVGILMAKDS